MKSTVITEQEELIPDERLDIAAAVNPATTSPLMPTGNPITMNREKSWSASLKITCPSGNRYGRPRKKAGRASPRL